MNQFTRWCLAILSLGLVGSALVVGHESARYECILGVCPGSDFRSLRMRQGAAARHARATWRALREARAAELAARVLPATARAGEPFVWFEPGVRPAVRQSVLAALAADRRAYAPRAGRGAVALLVVVDTGSRIEGLRTPWATTPYYATTAFWPSASTRGWCVSVVALGSIGATRGIGTRTPGSLLDACSYYDAFGPPSARLAAALDSGQYAEARGYQPPGTNPALRRAAIADPTSTDLLGYRCVSGDDDACVALVERAVSGAHVAEDPDQYLRYYYWPPRSVAARSTSERDARVAGYRFVDRLAVDVGPDEFARFWTADAPGAAPYVAPASRPAVLARDEARRGYRAMVVDAPFGTDPAQPGGAAVVNAVLGLLTVAAVAALAWTVGRRPAVS